MDRTGTSTSRSTARSARRVRRCSKMANNSSDTEKRDLAMCYLWLGFICPPKREGERDSAETDAGRAC